MREEVFCPICKSTKIVTQLVDVPSIERVSMDDLPTRHSRYRLVPAIMQYRRMKAECQECHHNVTWLEPC